MVDLLDYLRGAVGPDGVNGKPVGVKHTGADPGIFQVQRDGNTRRWFQVKGAWNDPPPQSDWEELWYDDTYIYRAVDTSRKPDEGGPYTLTDAGAARGSKWIKRHMNVGDKFFRNPTIYPFNMATGVRAPAEGQAPTWIKLHAIHPQWQGIPNVAELHWLLNENDTTPKERTFYALGLGQVGFIGSGMVTTPNGVFPDFPPATGVPVLKRKPAEWLPAMAGETTLPPIPADLPPLQLYKPLREFVISNAFDAPRSYPAWPNLLQKHEGIDLDTEGDLTVYAASDGVVSKVGYSAQGYGNYARVDAPGGWQMWYGHLAGVPLVTEGQSIKAGTPLGTMGATGNVFGTNPEHLHFTLARPDKPNTYTVSGAVDPTPYILRALPVPDLTPVTPPATPEPEPPALLVQIQFYDEAEKARYVSLHRAIADSIEAAPGTLLTLKVAQG